MKSKLNESDSDDPWMTCSINKNRVDSKIDIRSVMRVDYECKIILDGGGGGGLIIGHHGPTCGDGIGHVSGPACSRFHLSPSGKAVRTTRLRALSMVWYNVEHICITI